MQAHDSPVVPSVTPSGLLFLRGFASSLWVHRGHLVARAGSGNRAGEARFSRGSRQRIRRVVILGRGGFATWEALSWLKGVGASFLCLDLSGEPLAFSAHDGPDLPALRRAQALGVENGSAIEVTRYLLSAKLNGQARVINDHLPNLSAAAKQLTSAIDRIEGGERIADMLAAEAKAATAYWRAWEAMPIRFARADENDLPEHWQSVGQRHSPLSSGPRLAIAPAHAVINYLYSLAEFECRVALLAMGLDPGLGWFHRDAPYRDSAALDLMEAIRAEVDAYVAELLAVRTFSKGEFRELPSGQVRITGRLAHLLAASCLQLCERAVASHVEEVARIVASSAHSRVVVRTRLSQADRKGGRATKARPASAVPSACRMCGLVLDRANRQYCDSCIPTMKEERGQHLSTAGSDALRRMRSSSDDPAFSPESKAKRSGRLLAHAAAIKEWERQYGKEIDWEEYGQKVLPAIRAMTIPMLIRRTGLSQYYLWQVRKGQRRLHPRFWSEIMRESQ
jgi:CRISPR-associated endonuclease Cas1